MKRFLMTLALCLGLPAMAPAQDTSFAGTGADLVPVSDADVRFIDEHIIMEAQGHNAGWKVTSVFHLRNDAQKDQTVQLGFPFVDRTKPGQPAPALLPGRELNRSLIYDFAATVRKSPVKTQEIALDKSKAKGLNQAYDYAYVWDVTFKPGETLEVTVTYNTGITHRLDGCLFAQYNLKSGANWKGGTIGRTQITIIPHKRFVLCNAIEELESSIPLPTPGEWKLEGTGDNQKITWDLRNQSPKEDLSLCYLPLEDYPAFRRQWGYPTREMLEQLPTEELRIRRNQYYARYGYAFHTPDMKKHFSAQPWYRPDSHYSVRDLPNGDMEQIKLIKMIEAKRKHQKAIQKP